MRRTASAIAAALALGVAACDAGAPAPAPEPAAVEDDTAARLAALGYVAGVEPLPRASGVLVHHAARASAGWNLVTAGDGERARLLDMEGRIVHRWQLSSESLWPAAVDETSDAEDARGRKWRKTHVYPNGDLLVMHSGRGILKLDRDSRLLWVNEGPHHHDLVPGPEGRIHVLTRDDRVVPHLNPAVDVGDDRISVLSPDGETLHGLSILDALERSRFAPLWRSSDTFAQAPGWTAETPVGERELFHANAIAVLDGRHAARVPAFRRGNVLVSLSRIDAVAVVDPEAGEVVWARRLGFRRQHDPVLTRSGTLLLFDNQGLPRRSRVWEVDPASDALVWRYGDAPDEDLYSSCCGTVQRLANGNTLITETDAGRALEVTPGGEVVWEWVTPSASHADPSRVARVFEVERLPADFGADWLAPRVASAAKD